MRSACSSPSVNSAGSASTTSTLRHPFAVTCAGGGGEGEAM